MKTMQETSKPLRVFSKNHHTKKDIFSHYDNPHNLSSYEFDLILKTFFYSLMRSCIDEGKVYQLPLLLGTIGVYKVPTYGRGVFDYQLFIKEGIKVWKKNLHSSAYAGRIIWSTNWPRFTSKLKHRHIFKLKAPREMTRYLAKQIKEHNTISRYYDY